MDSAKLYIDTNKNLIDNEALVAAAKVLVALADNQDDLTFSVDEHGHHFVVPADLLDRFRVAVGELPAPKRRGRPRKVAVPDEAADAAETLSVVDEEIADEAPADEVTELEPEE